MKGETETQRERVKEIFSGFAAAGSLLHTWVTGTPFLGQPLAHREHIRRKPKSEAEPRPGTRIWNMGIPRDV